jgi:hypothetical protein
MELSTGSQVTLGSDLRKYLHVATNSINLMELFFREYGAKSECIQCFFSHLWDDKLEGKTS